MTGGNKSLAGPLFRAMIRACQLDGRIYTATAIDTGAIAGLALWFPPGKFLWQKSVANIAGYIISLIVRSDAQRNLGFNQFLESLSLKTREWWINTVSSADSYWFLPLISLSKYGPALAPFIKTALSPHVRPILLLKIFLTKIPDCWELLVSELYLRRSEISTPRNRHKYDQDGRREGVVFCSLWYMPDFIPFAGNDDVHPCALHRYRW